MTRLQEDISTIAGSTVGWIPSIISQLIQILISAGVIIYYDFSMLFIILLVAPIIFVGSRIFLGKMYKSNMEQREIASDIMSLYKESFQHLQSIKSFGLIRYFDSKMREKQTVRQKIDLIVNKIFYCLMGRHVLSVVSWQQSSAWAGLFFTFIRERFLWVQWLF